MLEVNQQDMDLGELSYGKTYNFSFTLTNKGDKEIHISKAYAGCTACTKLSVHNNKLLPGDVCQINVEFTPGSTGYNNKSVSVGYAEITQSTIKPYPDMLLKFKAFVK